MSIGSTVKQYPTGIDTFATWQDDIDNILAVIVNDVQDQVIAIETELGTDPAGSLTDLKTRLAVSINDDGTLKSSNQWTLNVNDIYNNNAGNVGIGTSTPQAKLHVIGDIVGKNDDTSNLGSAARRWAAIYMASTIDYAGDLNFDSSGTKVTFKTDGNVGIGSTQPAYTLDVGGDSRVIASTGAEGYTELQRWCLVSPQHDNYYLSLKQNVAVGNVKWQIDHRDDGVDYLANLVFNKGTIGIGTTNPQASLHVIGDIVGKNDDTSNLGSVARRWANIYMASTIDYASDLNFDSSGTKVTFKTDGKVGIGTDSPDAVIEATGVGTDIGKFRRIATGTGASCRLELGVDTTYYKSAIGHVRTGTGDNGLGKLYFAVDSVGDAADVDLIIDAKMVIDANGNVGIGTTTPQAKLHVIGDIVGKDDDTSDLGSSARRWANLYMASTIDYGTSLYFKEAAADTVTFLTGGNVGIGTTNPKTKLQVEGVLCVSPLNAGKVGIGTTKLAHDGLHIVNTTTTQITSEFTNNDATAGPKFQLFRDSASPAISDYLGEIEFEGEDGSSNKVTYAHIGAQILGIAGNGGINGQLLLGAMHTGSDTYQLTIQGIRDNIGIMTTTFDAQATGTLAIKEGVCPAAATADQIYIWAQDDSGTAECYVQDGSGNQSKISPHNEDGEWEFYSKNVQTGKIIRIHLEKFFKYFDEKFKTNFVEESIEI